MKNIEKIKALRERIYQDCEVGKYTGFPITLLMSLADYVIENIPQDAPSEMETKNVLAEDFLPDEPFCSILEFYISFPNLCSPCTLPNLLTADEKMRTWCAKRNGKKYYVQPKRTIWYLKNYGHSVLKKRATAIWNSMYPEAYVCQ